jgi:hypothetical protein
VQPAYAEPSSYYSAEDGEASEGFADDEVPLAATLSSPHSRDNSLAQVETAQRSGMMVGLEARATARKGANPDSTKFITVLTCSKDEHEHADLASRTSTRTTASNTRLTGPTSYMRHPEAQSTTTKPENGYPPSCVGRSKQLDAHLGTMSTPWPRKPCASAAGSEDAYHEGAAAAASAGEHRSDRPPLIPGSHLQMDT